jgi:serine/threonine protein phosphatase PrpC
VGAIVAAQTAVETICSACKDAPWRVSTARSLLTDAIEAAKTSVEAEAAACRTSAQNLATTLIVAIAASDSIAAAQVGDGVAVVEDRAGNFLTLTTPQNGEYINETTFLTSPQALDKAQVNLWRGSAANLALLTDGLQMLALEMTEGMPHKPFFSPLFNFVADVTDETAAREQLVAFLRSERITRRTDDDLTLLLATLL